MIDHLLAFVDEVAAHADTAVGAYWTPGTKGNPPKWHAETNPDILVWDPADDTTETVSSPSGDHEIIIHHPIDDRFRVMITLSKPDPDLVSHPQLELAVDHMTGDVLNTSFTPEQLATLSMQPVFFGSKYPFLTEGVQGLALVAAPAKKGKRR